MGIQFAAPLRPRLFGHFPSKPSPSSFRQTMWFQLVKYRHKIGETTTTRYTRSVEMHEPPIEEEKIIY